MPIPVYHYTTGDRFLRIIAAGLEMGADPANWSAVTGPVPISAFICVEFSVQANPLKWIPWPGLRLRAS